MNIAVIQTSVNEKNISANHLNAMSQIKGIECSDLFILPELFISGYDSTSIVSTADNHKVLVEDYCKIAKSKNSAILLGSLAISEGEKTYNRSLFINKNGEIISHYDKVHLFSLLNEDKYFFAGGKIVYVDYLHWRIGLLICYDLRFPELSRLLALNGCNLLIIPSAWPHNRINVFKQLSIARAIENQLWIVAVNRASTDDKITYGGNSLVIAPDGEVIAEAGLTDEILNVDIDLERVLEYRKRIPCYQNRRNDIYKLSKI